MCNKIVTGTKAKINHIEKLTKNKNLQLSFEDYCCNSSKMHFSQSKLARINTCGGYMEFLTNADRSKYRLNKGNFCKDRLCPICANRNSRKQAYKILELVSYIKVHHGYEFIFLTLTAPNVTAEKLPEEISKFQESFRRLQNTKPFLAMNKGFIRKLEITYNADKDTYHPHYHVLIAVNKSYFKKEIYISRAKWLELWQNSKRDNTITMVDARRAKTDTVKEIFEIAKYSSKIKDLLASQEIFDVIYHALRNKRIMTYNGIFKELKKLQDNNELDLSECTNLDAMKVLLDRIVDYHWKDTTYQEGNEELLTDEEIELLNSSYSIDFDPDK